MPILFPSTPVGDDFDRFDATGNLSTGGHDWVRIVSSAVLGGMSLTNRSPQDLPIDSADGNSFANSNAMCCRDGGKTYDSEVWATITALPAFGGAPEQQGVTLRMHDGAAPANDVFFQPASRYAGYILRHRGNGDTEIQRLDAAGAYAGTTTLASVSSVPWAVLDKMGLSIIDATLRGYRYDHVAGEWDLLLEVDDTVALAAGFPGLVTYSDVAAFGDIGFGTRIQPARVSFDLIQLPYLDTVVPHFTS